MDTSADTAAFGAVMDRWLSDPAFRDELRADPDGAIGRLGVALDPEQRAALRRQVELPDEALQARVSKGFTEN